MELVSKRIWGFPLMDRKCNTEELSSTRIKTIIFQFIFVFKFCLPERLLTFMVSSHPATLLPCYPGCQRCFSCLLICFAWATKREAPSKNIYKQMPLGLQWCATALCALWFWYFYALKPSLLESSQIQMDMSSYLVKVRPLCHSVPPLFSLVGVLWRTKHNTIDAILIQWHANKWQGILQLSPAFPGKK